MKQRHWLIAIFIVAAALRLYNLSSGDPVNDEVFYAFRGLGMMDFDEAEHQTTPLEWHDPGTGSSAAAAYPPSLDVQCAASRNTLGKILDLLTRRCAWDGARIGTGQVPQGPPNGRWWMIFSFHDHPPLVFAVQNVFMRVFGENIFAFRLPSALLGIASVYLLFTISSSLFTPVVGLLAAALMAVTLNHVYISRVGLQESYVIFFILLATYFFLKAIRVSAIPVSSGGGSASGGKAGIQNSERWIPGQARNDNYFLWLGIVFGLGLLAKYTVAVVVPLFGTYLLLFRRDVFHEKFLWLGALLALAIFSPVILYNIGLYQASGHFDFQLSYIFGQDPDVWKVAPGKEIGTFGARIANFVPRLIATNSWLFLVLFGVAFAAFLIKTVIPYSNVLKNIRIRKSEWFLAIALFWTTILILKIGPSYRFLTMLTPWMAVAVAVLCFGIFKILQPKLFTIRYLLFIAVAVVLMFEAAYAANNELADYPHGPAPWFASKVRYENYNWGYNELGDYFASEFAGKAPAITFDVRYKFLEALRDEALAKATAEGALLYPAFIVTDGNFDHAGKLWTLDRLHIYHAWPIISGDTYRAYVKENGADYFKKIGFRNYYFITPSATVLAPEMRALTENTEIVSIKNERGDEAFNIYVGAL